jgi:hypothetical protein
MNEVKIDNELGATGRNSLQRCRRAVNDLKHARKAVGDGFFIRREDVELFEIGQWRWHHG